MNPTKKSEEPKIIRFFVAGQAAPKGSWMPIRSRTGRIFMKPASHKERGWKYDVAFAAKEAMRGLETFTGKVNIEILIFRKRPKGHLYKSGEVKPRFVDALPVTRPDIDKLARSILDALTGVVWKDDSQVTDLIARKRWAKLAEGVEITVDEIQSEKFTACT